jgi:hypothetical protein
MNAQYPFVMLNDMPTGNSWSNWYTRSNSSSFF